MVRWGWFTLALTLFPNPSEAHDREVFAAGVEGTSRQHALSCAIVAIVSASLPNP